MPFNDIIKDPKESGIDLHSEIFIFSSLSIKKQYVCASVGIADEDKFNKLIKDIDDIIGEFDIEENDDEDYKYIVHEEYGDNFGLAWNNEVLLLISSPESRVNDDDLEDELERLMTLESEDKITDNDNFNDFYSDRTDICAWVSTDLVEGMVPASISNAVMEEMSDNLEDEFGIDIDLSFDDLLGNSAAFFFNFGEGNISIKAGLYLNDKMQEVVEEFTGIVPEELSIEYIVTFDASGRNSLNAIIMTIYNITEKFGKELIKEAIEEAIGFGGYDREVKRDYREDAAADYGHAEEAPVEEEVIEGDGYYDGYNNGADDAVSDYDYDEWNDEFAESFMKECISGNYSVMYDYCECALEEIMYEYTPNELENLDPDEAMEFIQFDTDCLELIDYDDYDDYDDYE
jgi:hypothetical protein